MWIALASALVAYVAACLALTSFFRRHGRVRSARLTLLPLGVKLRRVHFQSADIFASADTIVARVNLRELLDGDLRFSVSADKASISAKTLRAPTLRAIDTLTLTRSELVLVGAQRFYDVSLALTSDDEKSTLHMQARTQEQGAVTVHADVSAFLRSFTARAELRDLETSKGQFSCEVELAQQLKDGEVWTALLHKLLGAFQTGFATAVAKLPPPPAMSREHLLEHFPIEDSHLYIG